MNGLTFPMATVFVSRPPTACYRPSLNADVVGADRAAFERLGTHYLRFR
jgi:hypothetical protein